MAGLEGLVQMFQMIVRMYQSGPKCTLYYSFCFPNIDFNWILNISLISTLQFFCLKLV